MVKKHVLLIYKRTIPALTLITLSFGPKNGLKD